MLKGVVLVLCAVLIAPHLVLGQNSTTTATSVATSTATTTATSTTFSLSALLLQLPALSGQSKPPAPGGLAEMILRAVRAISISTTLTPPPQSGGLAESILKQIGVWKPPVDLFTNNFILLSATTTVSP